MKNLPLRSGALVLVLLTGFATGAAAQTADAPATSASVAPAAPVLPAETAHTDAQGRHLAPHGTLYMLTYVAAKTSDGVEGFVPGQEVHVVELHRPTHTLVVSDGHAQVEVPPSDLTHDMDIAALARQKDEANQGRITAYIQAEQVAYDKYERAAADATAKDLEHRRQEQQEQAIAAAGTPTLAPATTDQSSQPANASYDADGYYGDGGYGYGSPYAYFINELGGENRRSTAPAAAPATALPGKIAAPAGHAETGRIK